MQANILNLRLHRNLVFTVIDCIGDIFNNQVYADKAVHRALKKDRRWGSRDRNFIAETTYEIVRWKRLYAEIAEVKEPFDKNNLWRLFSVWCVLKGIELPNWNQIEPTPRRRIKGKFDTLSKTRKYRESIPDWIDEVCLRELGQKTWDKEVAALNKKAEVILRTNTLITNKKQLQQLLHAENIPTEFIPNHPYALKLLERTNVFGSQAFKKGYFEVQDASSQLVSEYLEVKPGMKVIDCCAGAGGKTLHLSSIMENKGQIIAMDIYEYKLKKLKLRARRSHVHNVVTKVIDSNKTIKKFFNKADRVLIDAPCSGMGVLKRSPDTKWKLQPEFLENIKKVQQELLKKYSKMVKSGGKLVYATCSVLPSENREQINQFLTSESGKDFTLLRDNQIFAHLSGFDGFYMALLEKI